MSHASNLTYAFSGNTLNRLTYQRTDASLVHQARRHAEAQFLLLNRDRVLVALTASQTHTVSVGQHRLDRLAIDGDAAILLGCDARQTPYFAIDLDDQQIPEDTLDTRHWLWLDLRSLMIQDLVPQTYSTLLAHARTLHHWHRQNAFCGQCGSRTCSSDGGYRRLCTSCTQAYYPRLDPVVIMLIVRGAYCLLGRKQQFAPRVYSCLAGFVEPGETIEEAVRRETLEESGIHTEDVRYHSSQCWPFPNNLMIACFARATSQAITVDDHELEDCQWFSRQEVQAMLNGDNPRFKVPTKIAIAHTLIQQFAAS